MMTATETLEKLKLDLIMANEFGLTDEQEEQFEFLSERLEHLDKAEQALLKIKCAIAKSEGMI